MIRRASTMEQVIRNIIDRRELFIENGQITFLRFCIPVTVYDTQNLNYRNFVWGRPWDEFGAKPVVTWHQDKTESSGTKDKESAEDNESKKEGTGIESGIAGEKLSELLQREGLDQEAAIFQEIEYDGLQEICLTCIVVL